jgi:hypothetical protein
VRIFDTRYSRDLRRYRLAWWMIRHEVRTRTVAVWSGLSMYRVKTLYESYAGDGRMPQRGASPYQVSKFWSSLQSRTETSVLAGFLSVYGVLPQPGAYTGPLETLTRGERLCRAYEEFIALWPEAELKLEHGMLLLGELVRGVEMEIAECRGCDVLVVADRLAAGAPRCAFCLHEAQADRHYHRRRRRWAKEEGPEWSGQGSLF